MVQKEFDVYISYSPEDGAFVYMLAERLRREGFSVFYDESEFEIGATGWGARFNLIKKSRHLLFVLSPDYNQAKWLLREVEIAVNIILEENIGKVVPILRRDAEIPMV